MAKQPDKLPITASDLRSLPDDRKSCNKCGEIKAISEFDHFMDKSRGKVRVRGHCKSCRRSMVEKYDTENREKKKSYNKRYHSDNLESRLRYGREYHWDNRDKILDYLKSWRKSNPHKVALGSSRRSKQIRQATPRWLTDSQVESMKSFYEHAKDCSVVSETSYEVDHIIPIKNKAVCGLNVPWNLQVLPKDMNRSKGNKFNAEAEQTLERHSYNGC